MDETTHLTDFQDLRYHQLIRELVANSCDLILIPPRHRLTMSWASPWLIPEDDLITHGIPMGIQSYVEIITRGQDYRCYIVWEYNHDGHINKDRFRQLQRMSGFST